MPASQNRRQKFCNRWALTQKLFVYSISYFNWVGLEGLFGGVKPTKAPRGEGTAASYTSGQPSYPRGHPTC